MKTLRALVVYESMFGNTERLAKCVAEGPAPRSRRGRRSRRSGEAPDRRFPTLRPAGRRRADPCLLVEPAEHSRRCGAEGRTGVASAAGTAGVARRRPSRNLRDSASPSSTRGSRRYAGCRRRPGRVLPRSLGGGASRCSTKPAAFVRRGHQGASGEPRGRAGSPSGAARRVAWLRLTRRCREGPDRRQGLRDRHRPATAVCPSTSEDSTWNPPPCRFGPLPDVPEPALHDVVGKSPAVIGDRELDVAPHRTGCTSTFDASA